MKLLEGQTVGIDLGTTYSSIARLDAAGQPVSLLNTAGVNTTASVVLFAENGQVIVGPPQERVRTEDPSRVVVAIKREMGNKNYARIHQNKRLTPEFISALILKKLTQDAERQIGPIANAVITVPYYFNDQCRKATQDAGEIAGLNVIDILNEPTAATLAYAWIRGELGRTDLRVPERTFLVYDLGGGTFDVTVVRYTPTNFRVMATDGDVRLGGLDWTQRIVEFIAEEMLRRYGFDPRKDDELFLQLAQGCEAAKRVLSYRSQTTITLTVHGKPCAVGLTRAEFEDLTADLLQRTRDTTELVLEYGRIGFDELDEIVLVGGSTHMPAVERMLTEICGRKPSRELDPDEAVSQGAAIHAAILEAKATGGRGRVADAVISRLKAVTTHDVNSHSLGVEISDLDDGDKKRNHIMIPRNTPIPHKVVQQFVTNVPNPASIRVRLLEGEASDVDACSLIGDFRIVGLPATLPVGSPVEIVYSYDANGRIQVAGRELTTMSKSTTEIIRHAGLTDHGLDSFKLLAEEYRVE